MCPFSLLYPFSTLALSIANFQYRYPILVKASAGGGGKGMRVVRERAALRDAIEGAQREAKSAFGDSALLIERYFEDVRHIEVQIIGDTQGNVVHCFERECSIQRRHQKVIEVFNHPVLPLLLFFLFRSPFMSSPFINTS